MILLYTQQCSELKSLLQCKVYFRYCTLFSLQYAVYTVYCTLYSVKCNVYTVYCLICSEQCEVQTLSEDMGGPCEIWLCKETCDSHDSA